MFRLSAAALVALACLAGTAFGQGGMVKFDGKVTIQQLTGIKCKALPIAVGQKFDAIYRVKVKAWNAPEVLQIHIPGGVIWAMADKNGDKSFRGRPSNVTGTMIYDTQILPIPAGSQTRFISQPAQPTDATTQIILTGTHSNFLTSDCVAKLRGDFKKRV